MCQYRDRLDFDRRIVPARRRVSWFRLALAVLAAVYLDWWLR